MANNVTMEIRHLAMDVQLPVIPRNLVDKEIMAAVGDKATVMPTNTLEVEMDGVMAADKLPEPVSPSKNFRRNSRG
jgi:hypothetical protein